MIYRHPQGLALVPATMTVVTLAFAMRRLLARFAVKNVLLVGLELMVPGRPSPHCGSPSPAGGASFLAPTRLPPYYATGPH
jgi:hypothetical protein